MFDNYFHGFDNIISQVNQSVSDLLLNPLGSWNNIERDVTHAVTTGAGNVINDIVTGASQIFTNAVQGMSDINQYVATYGTLPPPQQPQIIYQQAVSYEQPRVVAPPPPPDYRSVNPTFGRTVSGTELAALNQQQYFTTVQDLNRPLWDGKIPNMGQTKFVGNVKYTYVNPDIGYRPESQTAQNLLQNGLDALGQTVLNLNMPDITSFVTDVGKAISAVVSNQSDIMESFNTGINAIVNAVNDPKSNLMTLEIDGIEGGLAAAIGAGVDAAVNDIPYLIGSIVDKINNTSDDLVRNLNDYEGSVNRSIEYTSKAIDLLSQEVSNNRDIEPSKELDDILGVLLDPFSTLHQKMKAILEFVDRYVHMVGGELEVWYDANIGGFLDGIKNILEFDINKFGGLFADFQEISDNMVAGKYKNIEELWKDVNSRGVNTDLLKLASSIFIFFPTYGAFLSANLKPILRNIDYLTNAKHQDIIPDVSLWAESFTRGLISNDEYFTKVKKLGLNDYHAGLYANLSYNFLNALDYRSLYLRGIIDETTHDAFLERLGLPKEQVELLKKSYQLIPTPQDLITMAVRETFSPDIAKKFGQYEDFPEEFAFWAEKQGLTREWAERYWASHWGLPSPNMGFEMYQRRIIDYPTLQQLLKALDIMPYWRDKLTNLAYNPLTRVDVRRMFKLGVLTEEEMISAYRDIGYNEFNAQKLAEFTKRYETASGKTPKEDIDQRTITVVQRLYLKGKLSEQEVRRRLLEAGLDSDDIDKSIELLNLEKEEYIAPDKTKDNVVRIERVVSKAILSGTMSSEVAKGYYKTIGFTDTEADNEINLLKLERDALLKEEIVENIQELYTKRTITNIEATSLMGKYGFTSYEIQAILGVLDVKRDLRSKKLSEATLAKMYANGIITEEEYRNELAGLGYVDKYVEMILQLNIGDEGTIEQ